MGQLSDIAARAVLACSGATTTGATSGGGTGSGGLDWPVILGFMAGAALVALISGVGTLILARRMPPVPAPIPTWPQ